MAKRADAAKINNCQPLVLSVCTVFDALPRDVTNRRPFPTKLCLPRTSNRSLTANCITRTKIRRRTTSYNLTLHILPVRSVNHNNPPPSPIFGRSGCASNDLTFTSAAANSLVQYTASIAKITLTIFVASQSTDRATPATAMKYPNVVALAFVSDPWIGFVNLTFTPPGLKPSLRWSSARGRGGDTFTNLAPIRLGLSPGNFGF